jgi:excisionase family DNA binding protein
MGIEYLTMTEAREYLGVSKPKMWRLVKQGVLPAYSDPLDKRKRLVRKDDIEKLRLPQPKSSH